MQTEAISSLQFQRVFKFWTVFLVQSFPQIVLVLLHVLGVRIASDNLAWEGTV